MHILKIYSIICLCLFCSCGSKNSEQQPTSETSEVITIDAQIRSGRGKVLEAEDTGYPFAYLLVELRDTKSKEYFDINLEDVKDINPETLNQLNGKNVQFTYKETVGNVLMDILSGGVSVLNDTGYKKTDHTKVIEGVLSEADQITPGDLPGKIYITDSYGTKHPFEFFVTEEVVKVNGKKVTGYFEIRASKNIISINNDQK